MRIVRDLSQVSSSFDSCQREALTAFGRNEVFLEGKCVCAVTQCCSRALGSIMLTPVAIDTVEFWEDTKHLEVQILADGKGGVIHLFERDCTVQHRHQKVIELAPARNINGDLRRRLVDCAVALASQCNYRGAGTVEFLVRGDLESADSEFVFMEVNPRVQVEHTGKSDICGYVFDFLSSQHVNKPSLVVVSCSN
jgi:pyruvate carboxylase